jgi:hypothetical protein
MEVDWLTTLAFSCEAARVIYECIQDGVRLRLLQRPVSRHLRGAGLACKAINARRWPAAARRAEKLAHLTARTTSHYLDTKVDADCGVDTSAKLYPPAYRAESAGHRRLAWPQDPRFSTCAPRPLVDVRHCGELRRLSRQRLAQGGA